MPHRASSTTKNAPTTVRPLDPIVLGDVLRVASADDYTRWEDQIRRTGGCADPVHLSGWVLHKDKTTGESLHHYSTAGEPGGRLRIACGNRRASRCPSCAWTYAGDTYHLIRAGLAGDDRRDIPASVRDHPRIFATLTAPSFGPVHNRPDHGVCRCGTHHAVNAPELGAALDPDTYDYAGAVLFNNLAGQLWQRFTTRLRRELCRPRRPAAKRTRGACPSLVRQGRRVSEARRSALPRGRSPRRAGRSGDASARVGHGRAPDRRDTFRSRARVHLGLAPRLRRPACPYLPMGPTARRALGESL